VIAIFEKSKNAKIAKSPTAKSPIGKIGEGKFQDWKNP
jgi:hypothetical protein